MPQNISVKGGKKYLLFTIIILGFFVVGIIANNKINSHKNIDDWVEMAMIKNQEVNPIKIELMKSKPQIRMKKWGGEVEMGITYDNIKTGGSRSLSSDKMEYKSDDQEVHAYSLNNGNFEIEVILKEKPASNVLSFTLDNYKNLDFFYQPSLTEEYKNGYSEEFGKDVVVSETQVKDLSGNILVERPEKNIYSYAVYYKDHRDHVVGQTNYETGKAYHIFRPLIDDSSGKTTWGRLNIVDNKLTVTIPQEFLETAVYPVYHASGLEFGYSTIGGTQVGSGSTPAGSRFQAPAGGGTITKLTHYGTGGTNLIAAVYSDNSNDIDALLTQHTSIVTSATPNGWYDIDVTDYVFTASEYYWIVSWGGPSNYNYFYDAGATNQYRAKTSGISWPTWPDPFADNFAANRKKSIYATYTEPESGGTTATSSVEVKGGIKVKGGVKFR